MVAPVVIVVPVVHGYLPPVLAYFLLAALAILLVITILVATGHWPGC